MHVFAIITSVQVLCIFLKSVFNFIINSSLFQKLTRNFGYDKKSVFQFCLEVMLYNSEEKTKDRNA